MASLSCLPDAYLSEAHLKTFFNGTHTTQFPSIVFTNRRRFPRDDQRWSAGSNRLLVPCQQCIYSLPPSPYYHSLTDLGPGPECLHGLYTWGQRGAVKSVQGERTTASSPATRA